MKIRHLSLVLFIILASSLISCGSVVEEIIEPTLDISLESGVYSRDTLSGEWTRLSDSASVITSGDLDDDGLDDLIGQWNDQGGVFVEYASDGTWEKMGATGQTFIACDYTGNNHDELIGSWVGQGVYFRHSETGVWEQITTDTPWITCLDLDDDGKDDLVGSWNNELYAYMSTQSDWVKLSSGAVNDLAACNMGGDKKLDLVVAWADNGVYYRDTGTQEWHQLLLEGDLITCADINNDGANDIVYGIRSVLNPGLWVQYTGEKDSVNLSTAVPVDISAGDLNDDGKDDLIMTW
jgi:hypothetical protein